MVEDLINPTLDVTSLTTILKRLDDAILDCQSQVFAAIRSAVPEYSLYSNSLNGLVEHVERIKFDIKKLETALGKPTTEISGGSRVAALNADIARAHSSVKSYTDVIEILEFMLEVRTYQTQFDTAVTSSHFDVAADALQQASHILDKLLARLSSSLHYKSIIFILSDFLDSNMSNEEETYLVRSLKSQSLQRRSHLELILSELIDYLCRVFRNGIEITASVSNGPSLEQAWHAIKSFNITLEDKLKQIIWAIISHVIDPLFEAADGLSSKKHIITKVMSQGRSFPSESTLHSTTNNNNNNVDSLVDSQVSIVWSWIEIVIDQAKITPNESINNNNNNIEKTHVETSSSSLSPMLEKNDDQYDDQHFVRSTFFILETLESLFEFLSSYMFPGHPDLLNRLGELLWPELASLLQDRICSRTTISYVVLERLKEFETKSKGLRLIPFTVKTLTTFCLNHETVILETQRIEALANIRKLCIAMDPATIAINESNSTEDILLSSLENIKKHFLSNDDHRYAGVSLRSYLEQSPLILPKCQVSKAAFHTCHIIEDLLNNAVHAINAKSGNERLFEATATTLRDAESGNHDASSAAVFFCDILYLSRKSLLLLATVDKKLPSRFQPLIARLSLTDLVQNMRSVQEEAFNSMLIHKRQELLNICNAIGGLTELSIDADYMIAEAQVAEAIQFLKKLSTAWVGTLPSEVAAMSMSKLTDVFLSAFSSRICDEFENNNACTTENMNALVFLLSSTRDQLTSAFGELTKPILTLSTIWPAFNLFRDLLDADVQEFWAKRQQIRDTLPVRQLKVILDINSCQRSLPSRDIMDLIASA